MDSIRIEMVVAGKKYQFKNDRESYIGVSTNLIKQASYFVREAVADGRKRISELLTPNEKRINHLKQKIKILESQIEMLKTLEEKE